MRFCSLGSGSRGNGTLVQADDVCVLIDCGFSLRELKRRLAAVDFAIEDLSAILVTHEHADHAEGVGRAARASGAAVMATAGTWRGMRVAPGVDDQVLQAEQELRIGALGILPVTVPHDAREPVQFRFQHREHRLGVLTDLGHPTAHVVEAFRGCDGLLLEYNHDVDMLRDGSYPEGLKRRVGGAFGHLANGQSSALLECLEPDRLQVLVAGHLSEQNNTRELAWSALETVMVGRQARRELAQQNHCSGWFAID